ncbi:MAG TPA: LUD domain-containing protein [Geobacteraceae bacterium]|nr:LUD domain-containing protein [Geobacteraceae bacterium]
MNRDELTALFLENAVKAAAGSRSVANAGALRDALAELVPGEAAVYCPGLSDLEQAVAGSFPQRVADYAAAAVTVEEVLGGIAETGSIICASSAGRAVQASLLPPHHVAILQAGNIFATLDDFFAGCAATPPVNFSLITGPSRTADIELILAIGVHGPERLDVIVVNPAAPP